MIARPILMHARSIQNLLAGRKTQTRRIVKWKDVAAGLNISFSGLQAHRFEIGAGARWSEPRWTLMSRGEGGAWNERTKAIGCPYGKPGDLLWVREAFAATGPATSTIYRASDPTGAARWKPAIHMPRYASRLTLEVTEVRVERVQDCSHVDILREGVRIPGDADGSIYVELTGKCPPARFLTKDQLGDDVAILRAHWASLWENTNGPGAWARNDWVWVLAFKVHRLNVDEFVRRVTAHETGCRPFREPA